MSIFPFLISTFLITTTNALRPFGAAQKSSLLISQKTLLNHSAQLFSAPSLLKMSKDSNLQYIAEGNDLYEAVNCDNTEKIQQLINAGAKVNAQKKGHTPLHFAVMQGKINSVRILLANGAKVEIDNSGNSPVHTAYSKNYIVILQLLLKQNYGNVDIQNKDGQTILHLAILYYNEAIFDLLLYYEAKVTIQDNVGHTPLHLALKCTQIFLKKLLDPKYGDNINIQYNDGDTLLHTALVANDDYADFVDILIEAGANPNIANNAGQTPFYQAISNGHTSAVELFINQLNGANIDDIRDVLGNTLLHEAVRVRDINIVKILRKAGAALNTINNDGDNPLQLAVNGNQKNILLLFIRKNKAVDTNIKYQNGNTLAHMAAIKGYKDIIDALIDNGSKLNIENDDGDHPLHIAVRKGGQDAVKLLLNKGADIDFQNKNSDSPLHIGVTQGRKDIVELLLNNKANADLKNKYINVDTKDVNVNLQNNDGNTPLHIAIGNGYKEIAQLLLKKDVNIDLQNNDGQTPLHIAINTGYIAIIQLVLDKGPNMNIKNHNNITSMDLAYMQREQVFKMLNDNNISIELDSLGQDSDDTV
jgi:ankyrin repeat protein